MFIKKLISFVAESFLTVVCLKLISIFCSSVFSFVWNPYSDGKDRKRDFFKNITDPIVKTLNIIVPTTYNIGEKALKKKRKELFMDVLQGTIACMPVVLFNNLFFKNKGGIFKDIAEVLCKGLKIALSIGSISVISVVLKNYVFEKKADNTSKTNGFSSMKSSDDSKIDVVFEREEIFPRER